MIPLIPIAISLATKFAPMLIEKLAGPSAGTVAEKVIGMASSITGIADPQQAHDKIMKDENLQLEFEKASMNLQIELYKEDTERLKSTNATMIEESKSKSFMQRAWRPFNGFLFGITLFCDYFVSQIVFMLVLAKYPLFKFEWEHIPGGVYMLWASVLGVSAGSRGLEKITETKAKNGGASINITEMIKLFGKGVIGR